ncbi:MAG TPA: cytochrome c maturation protein CcmE [Myxococcales bacterium]|jgi:cytochrome c-type biogenesis protein CcmE|nr:cytochrome c maturation protein CcmE [Myxococcales bacterium]
MSAPSVRRRRTRWFAAAALAAAGSAVLAIAVSGIGNNLVYYWGPKELRAAGSKAMGATIRLGGQVATGSVKPSDGLSSLEFDVTDGSALVHVVSRGVPPQLFRDRIGVVVEGTLTTAGIFESRRLMVSHDNSYRAPADKDVDIRALMQSTEGLDPASAPRVAGSAAPGR